MMPIKLCVVNLKQRAEKVRKCFDELRETAKSGDNSLSLEVEPFYVTVDSC